MINLSIRKMRIFLATVEERNFTRAAVKLNISQPAATIIINQIEEEVGAELFVRQGNSRRAELTPRGRMVAETFSRIVTGYDSELLNIRDSAGEKRSEKRILLQSSLASALSPEWLREVINIVEGDRLVLETLPREQIIEQVYARDANLGLIEGNVDQERADFAPVSDYRLVLAVPRDRDIPKETEGYVEFRNLPEDSYILNGLCKSAMRSLKKNIAAAGVELSLTHEINNLGLLAQMMTAQGNCAVIPSVLAGKLDQMCPCTIHAFGPTPVQSMFGLLSPWGYMNRINLGAIRGMDCFVPGPEDWNN